MPETGHYTTERRERSSFIRSVIGIGNVVDSFTVDSGHANGAEIHKVTDTAVIIICNQTGETITEIIARPMQLKRLYGARGEVPPKWLLRLAYRHNQLRYNEK